MPVLFWMQEGIFPLWPRNVYYFFFIIAIFVKRFAVLLADRETLSDKFRRLVGCLFIVIMVLLNVAG